MNPPTTRQLQYLRIVRELEPTTLRDIGSRLVLCPHTVKEMLEKLRVKGYVTWERKKSRTIRTTARGVNFVDKPTPGNYFPMSPCGRCGRVGTSEHTCRRDRVTPSD